MTFSKAFVQESVDVLTSIDTDVVEQIAEGLAAVHGRGGRLCGVLRCQPAAVRRPHHAAHRGPVRRGMAPARIPPRAGAGGDRVGVAAMTRRASQRICIVGGAGFIGGHFVDRLLASEATEELTVYDNFSSGREWHLAAHQGDDRLNVVKSDARDLADLVAAMDGHDTVIHLASNPDIARAMTDPAIDFDQGTLLTHHVAEAARRGGVKMVLYASRSGVYGDLGARDATEDHGPLIPGSTYGASKLAGEGLLAPYAAMFGRPPRGFRI